MWQRDQQQSGPQSPFNLAQMRSNLFSSLVDTKLALVAAAQEGVEVSNSAVDNQIEKYVTQYLNSDRDLYIGRPAKNEKRPADPRQDRRYIDALSSNGQSISERESFYTSKIPTDQVRAELAIQGLQEKIKKSVPKPTDQEVANSFNRFTISRIMVIKSPDKPKEQVRNKAESYLKEATGGGDFAKLAKDSIAGTPLEKAGPTVSYSFDDRNSVPIEVREKVEKLQPGQITPLVGNRFCLLHSQAGQLDAKDTGPGFEGPRRPAQGYRARALQYRHAGFPEEADGRPERGCLRFGDAWLLGYGRSSAGYAFTDPAKYKQKTDEAITALYHSLNNPETNKRLRHFHAGTALLYSRATTRKQRCCSIVMLNGESRQAESADLRMMLGDSLVKTDRKDQAVDSYKIAMRMSKYNSANLEQAQDQVQGFGQSPIWSSRPMRCWSSRRSAKTPRRRWRSLRHIQPRRRSRPHRPRPAISRFQAVNRLRGDGDHQQAARGRQAVRR